MSNKNIIKILQEKLSLNEQKGLPNQKTTKTYAEIQEEIHNINSKAAKQIWWQRWILFVVIIVIAISHLGILYWFIEKNGTNNILNCLPFISDEVMKFFLGTTTVDVLGLLFVILKFLFPNHKK